MREMKGFQCALGHPLAHTHRAQTVDQLSSPGIVVFQLGVVRMYHCVMLRLYVATSRLTEG